MNETIRLLDARCSTRAYDPAPLTDEEKRAVLHAAMRAPTAGNMMLYSIIEIEDQALKDRLAVTCDHQPFIARAPWVLLFVADFQKWMDLFAACGCDELPGVPQRRDAGPRRPADGLQRRAHRRAERGRGGGVARHRLLLHRRHHGARRDARRAAAAAALHLPGGDAVPRPPQGPPATDRAVRGPRGAQERVPPAQPRRSCARRHASSTRSTARAGRGRGSPAASRTSTRASSPRTSPRR